MTKKIKNKGFTLLELMVVVAVISIMSATVTVGFSGFGEKVRLKETAGILKDTVKKLELETLEGHYLKNVVHFESDYLVVETDVMGQMLNLNYAGFNTEKCPEGSQLNINASNIVTMTKQDGMEDVLEGRIQEANSIYCVSSEEINGMELSYQLSDENNVSNKIRFLRFDLADLSQNEPIQIVGGKEYGLSIEAPYAKKKFYKNGLEENGEVKIILENEEKQTEEIHLN